jgi:hypothetical protein
MNRPFNAKASALIKVTDNLVSVDARLMSGGEFFRMIFPEKEPEPIRSYRQIAKRQGIEAADAFLAACNRFAKAQGWAETERPVL